MELKTKEEIISELRLTISMLEWENETVGWICAVDQIHNIIPHMHFQKLQSVKKEVVEVIGNVQS